MERYMVVPWLEPQIEEEQEANWNTRTNANNSDNINGVDEHLISLDSMLEAEWYMNNNPSHSEELVPNLQSQQQITIPSHSDPTSSFLMQDLSSSSFLPNDNTNIINNNNNNNNNPFGNVFDLDSKGDFLAPFKGNQMDVSAQTSPLPDFPTASVVGFGPTGLDKLEPLPISRFTSTWLKEFEKSTQKGEELNYESTEIAKNWNNNNANNNNSNNMNDYDNNGVVGEDLKGKKKEMPAKSLMAERRRRKKLSDRLYMLRSIVPKITKMDRASILGDAIDYMKELLQRINDLHNELESNSLGSTFPPSTTFHTMTPTISTLPSMVKEERCPSNVSSPTNQSPKVEVRVREGKSFSIHMYCPQKPGVLLSTMRALDSLGLEVQQAVINSFNGFTLDVFKAEQCKGHDVLPEQIKAVLLDTLSFHGMM